MWQPELRDGRRRLNLFRVARLIECDIGFLPTLRPSSWYPTVERRGKFKTRHASTILHPFPFYSWIDLKRKLLFSQLVFTSKCQFGRRCCRKQFVHMFTLYFDTKEIMNSQLFTNLSIGTFSRINSIFIEHEHINRVLMQQEYSNYRGR